MIQALGLEVEPAYQHFLVSAGHDHAPAILGPTKESDQ
jgi:hypothetical protein